MYINRLRVRQITGAIIMLPPFMVWVFLAYKLYSVPGEHPLISYFWAAKNTYRDPVILLSCLGVFVLSILAGIAFYKGTKPAFGGARYRKHLRGTRVVEPKQLARLTKDSKEKQVTIAGIPFPRKAENLHLLIPGGTGSGKSTLFNEIAVGVTKRRERFFVLDPGGEMLSRFYKPGDKILNPYDSRTEGWTFFNEIRQEYDFARYSLSLVPKGKTEEAEEWASYGRLLLRETAKKLWQIGTPDIEELHYWCSVAPDKELREFLEGTQALALFAGSNEGSKALTSARFVLSDKLPEHVNMPPGKFSLRDWLEDDKAGNLYITWREDMKEALRPLISAWVDALYVSFLSLAPDPNRRMWSFLDELGSLEKLATLEDALTKGRKGGLAVVAGIQSTSQLADIYGREGAQTLRSCFSSMVALRVARTDPETAEDLSKALGVQEVERDRDVSTRSKGQRTSSSLEIKEERAVSPSQLINLPDLAGYLSIVGGYPVARFQTQYVPFVKRHEPFIERGPMFAEVR
jgi:energy-coupling factor transporter ATP-binding protein EcfA2